MGDIVANNFVYLDGAFVEEQHLVNMAKQAGSMPIAEHYLCALLHHALIHGKTYLAEVVNDIRRTYQLAPYPTSIVAPASPNNMPSYARPEDDPNNKAREKYKNFDEEKKSLVLKKSLALLVLNDKSLFKSKACWIGIFLVVRDRLSRITQKDFTTFAEKSTPSDWKTTLQISGNPLSNLGRYLKKEKDEAYYDMKDNPFVELCKMFWGILRKEILTAE